MELDLGDLRALVAAADTGSFTDAAAELGCSQAAVSRRIARLESRTGGRLMRRGRRGCEPTALGQRALPHARRILADAARFEDALAGASDRLRVGYAWAALGRHTTPFQREWAAAVPDVQLRFVRWNSPTAGLAEGRCDVAVVRRPLDDNRFGSVVVGLERRVVAFAADDPEWRSRRSLRMAEVAERPVLVDPVAGTTVPELWPVDGRPSRTVETGDSEEWLDTIAVGGAVGTSSEATAVHNPRPDVLYRPLSDGPPITVRLVWWRDDPPAMLARLVERVAERYR